MRRFTRIALYLAIPLVVAGLSQLHGQRLAPNSYEFVRTGRLVWAIAYALLTIGACYVVGLPESARSVRSAILGSLAAVALASLGISSVQLLLGDALLPRFVVFGSALLIVPLAAGLSLLHAASTQRDAQRDRVFFIGGQAENVRLVDELAEGAERPSILVGGMSPGAALTAAEEGGIEQALQDAEVTVLVLDLRAQAMPSVVAQVAKAHERGVRVRTLSLFYEDWLGKIPVSELERVSLLFDIGEIHRARYSRAKRVIDVAVALVGMVVLAVAIPFIWAGNLVANRGPLFFTQERVGKGGGAFTILKFRTMRPGAGQETWTESDDPRVTPFGRMLRMSHLDELPQMVNILQGDLSLIGPRPEQVAYVRELEDKLPFYHYRHLVRPGLTGWAQVKYGYAADDRDALEKLQYEFFYLRRQSLGLDLRILARTARHVLAGGGR